MNTLNPALKLPLIVQPYIAALNMDIAPEDEMYAGHSHHYFSCGASALTCILHAFGLSGLTATGSILDFGCGAGRVTRWLRAAFPDIEIHACDIREGNLDFVKQTFRAVTWVSGTDIATLQPPRLYDLIWVGSVFTHLSAEMSANLFDKLMGWLNPKGLLIFTVCGRFVLHRANSGDNIYGLGERWETLVESYERTGYGYSDYPFQHGYGISVSRSAYWINLIESRANVRLVCLSEQAWDQHQDVLAVQKGDWEMPN